MTWFKSSHSGKANTDCVEVAFATQITAVRDSKAPTGQLTVSHRAWASFLARVAR
ncbi:DUF397 domain-containing protein [Amycolatopsis sp. NPDC059021]|uniref:DUF397 domain-containing protein n=1 Tax=Amycolatopsis sp. NPDC059021 TaxID=3346704 RepID=UPI00366BE3F6